MKINFIAKLSVLCSPTLRLRRAEARAAYMACQQGTALLSVLLLFALVSLIVTQIIAVNRQAIDKADLLFSGIKARQLLPLAESLASARLSHHLATKGQEGGFNLTSQVGVGDGWSIKYTVVDLQARINLNNVLFDSSWRPILENLFSGDAKKKIASLLIDWIDKDNKKIDVHGGEKQKYAQQLRKRVVPNQLMIHPSEFRQLLEVDDELWLAVKDKITALPVLTTLNVNSTSSEMIDLLLVNYTGFPLLTQISSGHLSPDDFIASPVMAGHNLINLSHIGVSSGFWLYDIEIKSADRTYIFHSRAYLDSNTSQIIISDRFNEAYVSD